MFCLAKSELPQQWWVVTGGPGWNNEQPRHFFLHIMITNIAEPAGCFLFFLHSILGRMALQQKRKGGENQHWLVKRLVSNPFPIGEAHTLITYSCY